MPGGADEVRMVGGAPGSCGHQWLGTSPHHHTSPHTAATNPPGAGCRYVDM